MKRLGLLIVLLLTVGIHAFAQNTHTVTGKILDENGNGYMGAGITLHGTRLGTVSDANGDFMLDVPDGDNVFIVQAAGYGTARVRETDQGISVRLRRKSKELEGNVVTAQDITKEKRELGYNTTTVSGEELTIANNVSAFSGLAGKVAGANITSSTGGPGGSTRIILRGENSIAKDNNALIVVDGVILNNHDRTRHNQLNQVDFGNSINDINPEDIQSTDILNGALGSVLYGSAGANGVIMITTKSGKHKGGDKPSKMDITYKMSYTQSDVLKLSDMQHTYGQGDIYGGVSDDRSTNLSWGNKFDGQMRPWGQVIDRKQMVKPYSDQPNNIRNFFDHGRNLTNFLSISGGSETSTYYLALNTVNSTGVIPNTFYNKYSIRFNGTTQLSNHFYSEINVNYINTYSRVESGGQSDGSVIGNLYQSPRDIPTQELKNLNNNFYSMQYIDTGGVERYGYYGARTQNPYWSAKHYDNRNKGDQIIGDVKLGYKCGEFNVFDRVGTNISSDRSYYKTPQINAMPVDPFYAGLNHTNPGGYAQNNYNGFRLYNDLIGTWGHALTDNFGMNVLLGHNVSIYNDETMFNDINPATNGLVLPNFYNFTNNQGPVYASNNITQRRTFAFYGDVSFNYRREVYLDLTARNDWSSTMVTGRNSYFYPGVNAAWIFTERLKGTHFRDKFLNYGKVRAGVAGVGSDALAYANNGSNYSQSPINGNYGSVVPPFNGVPAYQINGTFGNEHLKPERTREFEVGTDLSFFKDRISFSFTYYNRLTRNLLTAVPLAPSSGYQYMWTNVGDVSNKGEEYTLRVTPISTRYGLRWDVFGTYTHNVNTVESLAGGVDHVVIGGYQGMDIVAAVGKSYGTFYAADIEYWNGRPVVDATTGLPIATKKPVYRGSFQPKFMASWGTNLSYKGIKLHALFTTKQGGQFYSQNKMNMNASGTSEASTVNNRNPFVMPNSVNRIGNTNNYVTNTTAMSPYEYYTNVERNALPAQGLVNASYVRLQELSLSYAIPQKYYKRSPFGQLEAGIYGNNLLLWTAESNKYDDPENTSAGALGNGQGFNYLARPSLRNYGAYLKVTF